MEKLPKKVDWALFLIEQDVMDLEEEMRFKKKDEKLADKLLEIADKLRDLQNN